MGSLLHLGTACLTAADGRAARAQFYQTLAAEEITDAYLWRRLEPLLGYLPAEQRGKVQEALFLAYDSHAGQVRGAAPSSERTVVRHLLATCRLGQDAGSSVSGGAAIPVPR